MRIELEFTEQSIVKQGQLTDSTGEVVWEGEYVLHIYELPNAPGFKIHAPAMRGTIQDALRERVTDFVINALSKAATK